MPGGNSSCTDPMVDWSPEATEDAESPTEDTAGVTPGGWVLGNETETGSIGRVDMGKGPGITVGYGENDGLTMPLICGIGDCNHGPGGAA